MKKIAPLLLAGIVFWTINAQAQDAATPNSPNPGSMNFLLTGAGSAMFAASSDGNTFTPMALMVMPLTKINDRLFLESGLKFEVVDGDVGIGIEVLNLHYKVTPWLTAHFGKFPASWGNVLDMFGGGFVSRFPSTPIGLSDDGLAPTDQVGFGLQAGLQTGKSKMLYDIYVANGPKLTVDSTGADMTGHMSYEGLMDNNKNKAIGGKIGWLPFSNSSLQIDAFGQYAGKTGDAGSPYENVASTSYGVDLNFYKTFGPMMLRIMGQYEATQTDNQTYGMIEDTSITTYTFDNKGSSWYVAGTLSPTGSQSKFISNLELGARYVNYAPPKKAPWGGDPSTQLTLAVNYWLTWSSQLSFGYDVLNEGGKKSNEFTVRGIYKF